MPSIELKPCPFCGEHPNIDEYTTVGGHVELVRVVCSHAAHTAEVIGSPEFASKAWNTRAERTCRMDYVGYIGTEESRASIYQCSKCNMRYMSANVPDPGEYCQNCGAKVVEG